MEMSDLLLLIAPIIALIIMAVLFVRLRRVNSAMDEIAEFARSFVSGNFTRLYLDGDKLSSVSSALNGMASDMMQKANEMTEERNKLQAVLKCMNDGILITDIKGRVMLANPFVIKLLGMKTDMSGEHVTVATRNADIHNIVIKVIETEETVTEDINITYPDNLSMTATAVPLYSYDVTEGISGVVLSLHDITRIKRLEEMRKNFVANVSHELKTPITAIKGFAETLIHGAIDDKDNAVKFLDTIKAHSDRINSLVDDLLTLSRIELGDIKIEKSDVNVGKIADTVLTTLRGNAQKKGLFLRKAFPSEDMNIHADRDRLVQILLNLADNAIKFTEYGGVTIGAEDSEGKISLFVEDTGVGIAREHISRLGERFYRVDMARSRELGGTGLGLAIVKHLVKAHGWDMRIESILGKGTRVIIDIPL